MDCVKPSGQAGHEALLLTLAVEDVWRACLQEIGTQEYGLLYVCDRFGQAGHEALLTMDGVWQACLYEHEVLPCSTFA